MPLCEAGELIPCATLVTPLPSSSPAKQGSRGLAALGAHRLGAPSPAISVPAPAEPFGLAQLDLGQPLGLPHGASRLLCLRIIAALKRPSSALHAEDISIAERALMCDIDCAPCPSPAGPHKVLVLATMPPSKAKAGQRRRRCAGARARRTMAAWW